jgi:hypothetical protein
VHAQPAAARPLCPSHGRRLTSSSSFPKKIIIQNEPETHNPDPNQQVCTFCLRTRFPAPPMTFAISASTSLIGIARVLLLAVTLLLGEVHSASLRASADANDWSDWECPGFPCFIVNPYDTHNTTASRIETCGPVTELNLCNKWRAANPPHPCDEGANYLCDQTTCVQGTNAKCKTFCAGLLPLYQRDCNNGCDRWCKSDTESA